jgi:hypothetical protein
MSAFWSFAIPSVSRRLSRKKKNIAGGPKFLLKPVSIGHIVKAIVTSVFPDRASTVA